MALTTIGDRLTPSVPIEITFDAQKIAAGTKMTTIVGRQGDAPTLAANTVHEIVSIADPVAAQKEVDGLAGPGSEIGLMVRAFVEANALAGRSTFPAFRALMLPKGAAYLEGDGLELLKHLRSDMIVSCWAANSNGVNSLIEVAELISGPDRDLQGQFGSFVTCGSIEPVGTAYNYNSQKVIIASLPDSEANDFTINGTASPNSATITDLDSVDGVLAGQAIRCDLFPAGTNVMSIDAVNKSIVLSNVYLLPQGSINNGEVGTAITIVGSAPSQSEAVLAAGHAGAQMSSTFPYNPLKGVVIGGLKPPAKMSDRIQIDPFGSSEALLKAGVSPLYVAPGNKVAFIKTRTTYRLLPDGVTAVTDYNAWQQLVTLNDFREELYQITQNPPFNNNPGGTKASKAVADALLGEFVRLALSYEDRGAFQGVKNLVKLFEVEPSKTSRGRFDFKLPVNVLPDLDVVAINVFSTTMFDFTL